MIVAGVDGCKKGWFAIVFEDERLIDAKLFTSFSSLVKTHAGAKVIAVDIPIGSPQSTPRKADMEAKSFLGKRASSVFLIPPRRVLEEDDYQRANRLARESGKGISKQAHALRKKIFEVEKHAKDDPRIIEVHPEVSFREMAGKPLASSKKTWDGLIQRLALLRKEGIDLENLLPRSGTPAAPDDVVDAAAAAWTASRVVRGEAFSIPESPSEHWEGRPIAIWC
jgi:predicted RNase H-like nuclease